MKHLTIDTAQIQDLPSIHHLFRSQLHFPSYYGNNLDALYDMLSTWDEALTITVLFTEDSQMEQLTCLLQDVGRENPKIQLEFLQKK